MSAPLLAISGLEAGYGQSQVLFGIDLSVDAGEVVSLMGRNGMGKTTTVRALMGLLPVTAGRGAREVVEAAVREVAGDGGGGRRPFATGVSRMAPSPDDLPVAYEQARKALTVGRQMHGPRAVAHFDDLGVFRLLSLIDDDRELSSFVRETL